MNWRFWESKKKQEQRKTEEDRWKVDAKRLFDWRERLLKTAYAMRVQDRVISRYVCKVSDPNPEVRKILVEAWSEQMFNEGEIWHVIGDIEGILTNKYGMFLFNPIDIHDMLISPLNRKLEYHDRTLPTVQPRIAVNETSRHPSDAPQQ